VSTPSRRDKTRKIVEEDMYGLVTFLKQIGLSE
jgi:hypothetical protein